MGFLICRIHHLPASGVTIETRHPLALAGPRGLFARHLPELANEDGTWSLSAEDLLKMAEPNATASDAILLELTPQSRDGRILYRLLELSGRTMSLITDALFRFKVLSPVTVGESAQATEPCFSGWIDGPERYEQLRLDGGVSGGQWAWGESPSPVCATVLAQHKPAASGASS
jgi:hypothetical protein